MKRILLSLLSLSFFFFFLSCNKNGTSDNEKGTSQDYTARETPITRTFKATVSIRASDYVLFEDFNHKYDLIVGQGKIGISPYLREDGAWKNGCWNYAGFESVGKVNSLNVITEKCSVGAGAYYIANGGWDYFRGYEVYLADIQPDYGYTGSFCTSDSVFKNIRLRITGYTLATDGAIDTITVEYQLF